MERFWRKSWPRELNTRTWTARWRRPRRWTSRRVSRPMTSSRSLTTSKISSVLLTRGICRQEAGESNELFEAEGFGAGLGGESLFGEGASEGIGGPIFAEEFEHHFAALGEGAFDDFDE